MANAVNWFEIPAADFDRACDFYGKLFGTDLEKQNMMGMDMAFFPADWSKGDIGGSVVKGEGFEPSAKGSVVYLNGGEDLTGMLEKVETIGGSVVLPKTSIGDNGYIAHFMDTEGNRVALHSPN